jgi:hypothetical protein
MLSLHVWRGADWLHIIVFMFPMSLRGDMPGKEQARCKIVQSTNESRRLYSLAAYTHTHTHTYTYTYAHKHTTRRSLIAPKRCCHQFANVRPPLLRCVWNDGQRAVLARITRVPALKDLV